MKTRTTLILVLALLVLGAFPASATDSQEDVCDGLRNALDVLENQSRANQRAISKVTAQAEDAGCRNTIPDDGQQLCESFGGTFTDSYNGSDLLWKCSNWTYSDLNNESLETACENDGGYFHTFVTVDEPAASTCTSEPLEF